MKTIITIILYSLCCLNLANATQIQHKELNELVKVADHIIGGKIIKVDMIDKDGKDIADEEARTGPGLNNTIRLHLKV
jgi:hypothetical protein